MKKLLIMGGLLISIFLLSGCFDPRWKAQLELNQDQLEFNKSQLEFNQKVINILKYR